MLNKKHISLLTALLLSQNVLAQERPMGGWRFLPADEADFVSEYNYYGHAFNTQKNVRAMIMGKIARTPHTQSGNQAILVANGVAMPMRVDEGNHYARPYAFGAGSNSIEVKNALGQTVRRSQFYEANNGKVPAKLRIVFISDADEHDIVDLHVITPNGEHAWYGQRVIPSGGAIDQDAANDGSAPQIFATPNGVHGIYQVHQLLLQKWRKTHHHRACHCHHRRKHRARKATKLPSAAAQSRRIGVGQRIFVLIQVFNFCINTLRCTKHLCAIKNRVTIRRFDSGLV